MMWVLLVGHACLGVIGTVAAAVPGAIRVNLLRFLAGGGLLLSVGLVMATELDAQWRGAPLQMVRVLPAAAGIASAWLVAGVFGASAGGWKQVCLIGVASSGLAMAAVTSWSAPLILPWLAGSGALWFVARMAYRPYRLRLAIALSDALLVVALLVEAAGAQRWMVPADGPWHVIALLTAAGLLRAGTVGLVWHGIAPGAAASIPLMVAGGLVVLPANGAAAAYAVLPLLAVAVVAAIRTIAAHDLRAGRVAVAATATQMAMAILMTTVRPVAAAGAVAIATVVALWPLAPGRGGPQRALVLALVPLATVASAVPAGSRTAVAVGRPATAAALTLLAVVVAALLAVAGLVGRSGSPRRFDPAAVLTLSLVALTVTVAATLVWAAAVEAAATERLALHSVAAGSGFALAMRRRDRKVLGPRRALAPFRYVEREPALRLSASVIGSAAVVGAVWMTVAGMRVGFL